MKKELSAGAVLFRREGGKIKYLLLHYGAGHWDFVKGHVEAGEEEKQTVMRELREETSIANAEFVPGFKKEVSYYFKDKTDTIYKTVVFYLLETKESEVKLSFEHIGYRWATLQSAVNTLTFDNAKEIVQAAEKYLKTED